MCSTNFIHVRSFDYDCLTNVQLKKFKKNPIISCRPRDLANNVKDRYEGMERRRMFKVETGDTHK